MISSPLTPSLKLLSPSSITSEQKTADANKGIKIVEIIILRQNGWKTKLCQARSKARFPVPETRWNWQPSMDRVGGLWLAFVLHVLWIPWGLSSCDWWNRVLGNGSTCLDKHLSPQNTKNLPRCVVQEKNLRKACKSNYTIFVFILTLVHIFCELTEQSDKYVKCIKIQCIFLVV